MMRSTVPSIERRSPQFSKERETMVLDKSQETFRTGK